MRASKSAPKRKSSWDRAAVSARAAQRLRAATSALKAARESGSARKRRAPQRIHSHTGLRRAAVSFASLTET